MPRWSSGPRTWTGSPSCGRPLPPPPSGRPKGTISSSGNAGHAAQECYRNAGTEAKLQLATAHALEAEGDHAAAAPLYEQRGETALAAACWERAGAWEHAERSWLSAGDLRRAQTCGAHLAESRGKLEAAALAWEALGETAKADSLWRRAGAFDRLARSAQASGEHAKSAELFERARMSREAAAEWERAGDLEHAGDLWLRVGSHAEAARLFRRSGSTEKLLRCLRHLGNHREAALLFERRGDMEKAVQSFAAAALESPEARQRLESEIPAAKTKRSALKAAIRLAALGRDAEAAPLFVRAGEAEAAARRYERVGDHGGLARCHELAGQWLEAARELGLSPSMEEGEPRRAAEIQRLLFHHLDTARLHGNGEREAAALLREAERQVEQGNLVAALARFRLCGKVEEVADISRRLGWHEEAIDWMLSSDTAAALRYARKGGFPFSIESYDRLTGKHLVNRRRSVDSWSELHETLFCLLAVSAPGLPAHELTEKVETFFERAYGRFASADLITSEGFSLLLEARASAAIMNFLDFELQIRGEPTRPILEFGERLAQASAESRDLRLMACHAYFRDMRTFRAPRAGFEAAAALLPLQRDTAAILGRSSQRYREAVDLLMAHGAVEDAEMYCRINHDPGLAGSWAEKRGSLKDAVRYYRDARDKDGALRCAQASGDQAMVARAWEWRGEYAQALRIWKKLGRTADVARLLRKRPLLGG